MHSVSGLFCCCPALSLAADAGAAPVTFAKDIAPIFQEKCQECHRKGTAAPMSLVTYEETRPWAKSIRQRVITRNMPPWHLDKTVGIQQFQNDRSLTDAQIATIVRWVDAGAPMGDPKDMPPPKQWPEDEGWQLAKVYGQPDLVLKSEPYTMPAHGQDVWFKPLTDVPITEARWVRAVEMRPGNHRGPQDHASRAGAAGPGGTRRACQPGRAPMTPRGADGERGPADGMGHRQELRHLPAQHRQAAAARIAHLVGTAPSRGRRGDSRSRRAGRVPLPQG